MSAATDRIEIRELVENWVVWRDAGDWDRFRTVWHDDGRMMATWFQGPADDFIRVSREGFERGVRILHFLGGTSIDVAGDRAVSQTKMTITQRARVARRPLRRRLHRALLRLPRAPRRTLGPRAAPADLRAGPAEPGRSCRRARRSIGRCWSAFRSATATSPTCRPQLGFAVKPDMPGLTGAEVEALYARGAAWLAGDPV